MQRFERFTFAVNKKELALIRSLADNLKRSQSDAIRFVVTEAAKQLEEQNKKQGGNDHERD